MKKKIRKKSIPLDCVNLYFVHIKIILCEMKIDQYGVLSFVGHCTDTFYQMLLFIQLDLETHSFS